MLAEIELDNDLHGFQPGTYAQVTLATTQNVRLWAIPSNTLQMRVERSHVAVLDDDNVEIKRETVGETMNDSHYDPANGRETRRAN